MKNRIQIVLTPEAALRLEQLQKDINAGFKNGKIKIGDLVSEIILHTEVDVKDIRRKYTDLKKSLIELAKDDHLSVESLLKFVTEFNKGGKKSLKAAIKDDLEQV